MIPFQLCWKIRFSWDSTIITISSRIIVSFWKKTAISYNIEFGIKLETFMPRISSPTPPLKGCTEHIHVGLILQPFMVLVTSLYEQNVLDMINLLISEIIYKAPLPMKCCTEHIRAGLILQPFIVYGDISIWAKCSWYDNCWFYKL